MADRRIPYPLTLPSSFSYISQDGSLPQTPERPTSQPELAQSVSAPTARFRLRRSTGSRVLSDSTFTPLSAMSQATADLAVPSIEVAVDDSLPTDVENRSPYPSAGYLSPHPNRTFFEPPTTPVLQTVSFDGSTWKTAKQRAFGASIVRPISVCSNSSSSSDESDASSSFASSSYGGTTCTSPERSHADPFSTPSKDDRYAFSETLMAAGQIPDFGAGATTKRKANWTQAMDDHLWRTYQHYLGDPTVTPIKIVPGNAPPLGVCYRVARRAKQTWREPKPRPSLFAARFSTPQFANEKESGGRGGDMEEDRQTVSEPETDYHKSSGLSATWPKHNATRRRLRQLAKNRATIPTHYMRMMASRSPSPFTSSSRSSASRHTIAGEHQRPASKQGRQRATPSSPGMGTRGVRLALATATSETMQPDGPLARWQRDTPEPTPEPVAETHVPFNFNNESTASAIIPSSPAVVHASSASPQQLQPQVQQQQHQQHDDHLMTDAQVEQQQQQPPRLGSPFVPNRNHTWAAPARRQRARPHLVNSTFSRGDGSADASVKTVRPPELLRPQTSTGPRSLRSPIQFTSGTFPYNNRSLGKRRAESSLEDIASPRHGNSHRRPAINDVFGPSLAEVSREGAHSPVERRRVRLRGFSLNDAMMQSQQDRQSQHMPTFSGMPEGDDPFVESGKETGSGGGGGRGGLPGVLLNATAHRQLGSPFQASGRPRFRVRHLPHNSLDSHRHGLFGSIEERLGDN